MTPSETIDHFLVSMTKKKSDLKDMVDECFVPHALMTSPLSKETEKKGIYQNFAGWTRGFPDLKTYGKEVHLFSNKAVLKWTTGGRQLNPFFDMEATDRKVEITGLAIWEFNEDGLVETVNYQLDMIDFMQQLGFHMTPEMYPMQEILKDQYQTLLKLISRFRDKKATLTEKEVLCVSFYILGYTTVKIAELFSNSVRTIQTHISHSMEKLQCSSKQQLTELAHSKNMMHVIRDFSELVLRK